MTSFKRQLPFLAVCGDKKKKFESRCGSHSVLNMYIFIIKEKCSAEKSRGRETLLTKFKEQILYKTLFFYTTRTFEP